MQGKWDDVVKIYRRSPEVHWTKITRSGDTALHMAVSDRKESIVLKLFELINNKVGRSASWPEGEWENIYFKHPLQIANEQGNTPLHLAASTGNVQMCLCITEELRELIGIRNNKRETPLFVASLHGKKGAFVCLHHLYGGGKRYDLC